MSDIYTFLDYRDFLMSRLAECKAAGVSMSSIAHRCGFKSSDYLQQIVRGRRNLSSKNVGKVGKGLGLDKSELEYFRLMHEYSLESDEDRKGELFQRMRSLVFKSKKSEILDFDMNSHWLHGVVYEMAGLKDFSLDPVNVSKSLFGTATPEEARDSIDFLLARGYLRKDETTGRFERKYVTMARRDDMRQLEVQAWHRRFLELAKHRLNDDVADREFQGLTIAAPLHKLDYIKQQIRDLVDRIDDEISAEVDSTDVLHCEFAVFRLTRDRSKK